MINNINSLHNFCRLKIFHPNSFHNLTIGSTAPCNNTTTKVTNFTAITLLLSNQATLTQQSQLTTITRQCGRRFYIVTDILK